MFRKELRQPIYNIYGFVRLADEIVDTFHAFDKRVLIQEFRKDTFAAINRGISLNPVLQAFQEVVNTYGIEHEHIDAFLRSMEWDLDKTTFSQSEYEEYIYGSAEVVGLMCLKIFLNGDQERYQELESYAKRLGSAFQKVNFLRDMKSDYEERGRVYFPGVEYHDFTCPEKVLIEEEIMNDFEQALLGIRRLPSSSRLGVFVAYKYYVHLLRRIKKYKSDDVKEQRIRISNVYKLLLLGYSTLRYQLRNI